MRKWIEAYKERREIRKLQEEIDRRAKQRAKEFSRFVR